MSTLWVLLLSNYFYISLTIFLFGIVWRYESDFIYKIKSKKRTAFFHFIRTLFTLFLLVPLFIALVNSQITISNYLNIIKAIILFDFVYLETATILLKFYIFIFSNLLIILGFIPLPDTDYVANRLKHRPKLVKKKTQEISM